MFLQPHVDPDHKDLWCFLLNFFSCKKSPPVHRNRLVLSKLLVKSEKSIKETYVRQSGAVYDISSKVVIVKTTRLPLILYAFF